MSEGAVVNACLRLLSYRGIMAWRNNTGAYKPEGSKRWISYGCKGSADIFAVLPKSSKMPGVFVGIECKSQKGRLQDSQKAWGKQLQDSGGLYFVVRDVSKLNEYLEALF